MRSSSSFARLVTRLSLLSRLFREVEPLFRRSSVLLEEAFRCGGLFRVLGNFGGLGRFRLSIRLVRVKPCFLISVEAVLNTEWEGSFDSVVDVESKG